MDKDTTLEVRIHHQAKSAAQARAEAQGYTLSEAVRRLLALWVDGTIDLAVLDRLQALPTLEELQALARTLGALDQAIDALEGRLEDAVCGLEEAAEPLGAFLWKYGAVLGGEHTEPRPDLEDLPDIVRRVILRAEQRGPANR
jgi:antitoxin component of RelBE/YafQ-DinJ toxin-antitoxin module